MDKFPADILKSIVPLMALSLLTSVSGFSMGPEAPMVCHLLVELFMTPSPFDIMNCLLITPLFLSFALIPRWVLDQ